jgi:hypothetical protein
MDIFRFGPVTGPLVLNSGQIVGPIKSIMWVERYLEAGEFVIKARLDSGVREQLSIGTFISHVDSSDVMVVENHEISDSQSPESEVIISGRSFETFLENRIIGANQWWPTLAPYPELTIPPGYIPIQVVNVINQQISPSMVIDPKDALHGITATTNIASFTGESVARIVKRNNLYSLVLELLAIENLGICTKRPGLWGNPDSPDSVMVIHQGADRTKDIVFSHDSGDIESADYLWTNKNLKNAALVTGRFVEIMVKGPESGLNRRTMYLDASDIDNSYSDPPVGAELDAVRAALVVRGNQAISAHNDVVISNAQAARNLKKYVYRRDFDVGDLVTITGDFDETSTKRVIEYVEIEDETGESGYPTLSEV